MLLPQEFSLVPLCLWVGLRAAPKVDILGLLSANFISSPPQCSRDLPTLASPGEPTPSGFSATCTTPLNPSGPGTTPAHFTRPSPELEMCLHFEALSPIAIIYCFALFISPLECVSPPKHTSLPFLSDPSQYG